MEITILGIDPGSRVTGFGIVKVNQEDFSKIQHVSHGIILANENSDEFPRRMGQLGISMKELCAKYKPHYVVIEKIFLGKNADSAFKLGHARGVIMYEADYAGAKVIEYATRSVKKSITGNGGADKDQVRWILQQLLKIAEIKQIDASDALAMAYMHGIQLKTNLLMESGKL